MAEKGKKALTAEEAKEKLASAKEKLLEAKDAMKAFCKENSLKASEDHSENDDEKVAKKWKKLNEEVKEKQSRVEKYTAMVKESKKSGGAGKKAKYNYPKSVTTGEEKKKFRTETRAKAKKAGVSVDEYLKNPEKYAAALEKAFSKKADKKKKKKSKEEPAKEEKKKKKKSVEAPAKEADESSED